MYKNDISLNQAYTMGLERVGCGVCPFASDWSEYVISKRYPDIATKYIAVVEDMARNIGISSKKKIDEYIATGNWKKNAGGKGLMPDESRMDIITKEPVFECIVTAISEANISLFFPRIAVYPMKRLFVDMGTGGQLCRYRHNCPYADILEMPTFSSSKTDYCCTL